MAYLTAAQATWALANPQQVRDEIARVRAERSLRAFATLVWPSLEPARPLIGGWCLDAICEHLQAVSQGQIKELLINVPPGCTKSLCTSVLWPAFEWGPLNRPSLRYMCASYSTDLTYRDNRKCRRLIASPIYQRHWGSRFHFVGDANRVERFETNHTGFKLATSVGGLGTGERVDRIVIDDPHKNTEAESEPKIEKALEWFTETLTMRGTDANMAKVVIMQRISERDLSGFIIAKELGYEALILPMRYEHDHPHARKTTSIGFSDPRVDGELLWPERFDEAQVEKMEMTISAWGGSYGIAGQLQQRPAPRGGGMFKDSWWVYADASATTGVAVRGWDLAASTGKGAAWTAGVKMRRCKDGLLWIEDVVRLRGTPKDVYDAILATAIRDGRQVKISIPQDPGQSAIAQKNEFGRLLEGFEVSFSPETGKKEDRAGPLASMAESGNVRIVRGPWNDVFVAEARVFPAPNSFKDQVDGASRAHAKLLTLSNKPHLFVAPRVFHTE